MQNLDESVLAFLRKALESPDLTVLPLAGDASSRRYYRIVRGQQSWVLMTWEAFDPETSPFLSVQRHFEKSGVRVPSVVDLEPSLGLILLEDLGDLTLERKFWESRNPEDALLFYRMAIDEMVKIHHHATRNKADCTAFRIQFDTEKFLWEMNYGKDNLILGVLSQKYSDSTSQELQKVFLSICSTLDQEPKKIAHRDYHSRNLMIKLDEMGVIDFQDARLGPLQYDLVSLLRDSYTDLSDSSCQTLIQDYLEKSREFLSADFSFEHFMRIYEVQTLQRCFKACGSFASFFHQRKDRRYLKYLTPTLKRVFKSLNHFPEYKVFADLLIDSGALEKDYESL